MRNILLLGLTLGFSLSVWSKDYKVDPSHSNIGFTVSHMVVTKVKGTFTNFSGEVSYDAASKKITKANGEVDASTLNTNEPKRDGHLKSPDFFDVAKYPKISFKMTKYEGSGNTGKLSGDFTMHGVTKPLTLTVEIGGTTKDPGGNERLGLSASGKISRKDYGMTWNKNLDSGGVVVGDDVTISLEIEGVAAK